MAGVRRADGRGLADSHSMLGAGELRLLWFAMDTTRGVASTHARLARPGVTRLEEMAHDGLAHSIVPVHTLVDGDAILMLATSTHPVQANLLVPGAVAAEAVADAVVRTARTATGIPGFSATGDLS